MKPVPFIQRRRGETTRPFPLTDFNYYTADLTRCGSGRAGNARCRFRDIAREYFRIESRRDFRIEAIFFAIVMLTIIPALVDDARALFTFLQTIAI